MQQQAYISIIELLVICLKEGSITLNSFPPKDQNDETLERLHINGLKLLAYIMSVKDGEPEIKMQFQLAGMVSLTILLVEKLKFFN